MVLLSPSCESDPKQSESQGVTGGIVRGGAKKQKQEWEGKSRHPRCSRARATRALRRASLDARSWNNMGARLQYQGGRSRRREEARCPLCSQNAHDETVLARCAQSRTTLATSLYEGKLSNGRGHDGRGQVLQSNISRRVAGIWFIWFFRSVSCVWFDERERQDRPAHRIDRL